MTLAAARRLRSSYCSLAHGSVLLNRFGEPMEAIAQNHRAAGLDPIDVAAMDLAERVVEDATSINDADLQKLRDLELSEEDIMDVVLAAAARCFCSKTLDALGIQPDASYRELDPQLRKVLVIGRPIADEYNHDQDTRNGCGDQRRRKLTRGASLRATASLLSPRSPGLRIRPLRGAQSRAPEDPKCTIRLVDVWPRCWSWFARSE